MTHVVRIFLSIMLIMPVSHVHIFPALPVSESDPVADDGGDDYGIGGLVVADAHENAQENDEGDATAEAVAEHAGAGAMVAEEAEGDGGASGDAQAEIEAEPEEELDQPERDASEMERELLIDGYFDVTDLSLSRASGSLESLYRLCDGNFDSMSPARVQSVKELLENCIAEYGLIARKKFVLVQVAD